MIEGWGSFKAYVRADFRSRGGGSMLRNFVFDPVARFQLVMRLNEYLWNTKKPFIVRLPFLIWFRRLSVRLGFSLGFNIFGPGLAIVHYGLLIVNPASRIGKNCRIHQGVHIGANAGGFVDPAEVHKYSPVIGDNVYLAPGAKLYGPIRIGDNVTIGANAVVTRSFEGPGLTIAGVPAKVISTGGTGERVVKGAG